MPVVECPEALPMKEAIRLIRLKRGVSQGQLARLLALQRPTITRYENGVINIHAQRVREIAAALQIDPGLLYRAHANDPEVLALEPFAEVQHG